MDASLGSAKDAARSKFKSSQRHKCAALPNALGSGLRALRSLAGFACVFCELRPRPLTLTRGAGRRAPAAAASRRAAAGAAGAAARAQAAASAPCLVRALLPTTPTEATPGATTRRVLLHFAPASACAPC